jgi:energy-coupling factor transport system ATP-binding protein
VIEFKRVTYTYPEMAQPVLQDISFRLPEAALALVVGPSGAGKSTLLRCLNGLVPHFNGGTLTGDLQVAGLNPVLAAPQVMSRHVGFVFQDPEAQFVMNQVEDEIAFALENAAMPPQEMRLRVEEVLDMLELAPLRQRRLETLSGGERQRVAIAAALAFRPQVLVLDEPTSQLDPQSAEDVLQALTRLNTDLGLTVVLAEHRLERVLPFVDQVLYLPGAAGGGVMAGTPDEVLPHVPLVPPLIQVARGLDWRPLPLTIKEGLRFSRPMREKLPQAAAGEAPRALSVSEPFLRAAGLEAGYDGSPVLRGADLAVASGEIAVLMGRNGSGKTTLLKALAGLVRPQAGRVTVAGEETAKMDVADICRRVGYLPQDPNALLFADTVMDELRTTLGNYGLTEETAPIPPMLLLERLGLDGLAERYPRDLSAGERQRVALAAITVTQPGGLLLDEPTRGLDYETKVGLARLLRGWRDEGMAVLLVTHDVEFAALVADRVLLMSQGEIIGEGAPAAVMGSSPLFAPQVARLFPGTGWLTAEDALGHLAPR